MTMLGEDQLQRPGPLTIATSDAFTVTVSGDVSSFITWKERMCSILNNYIAPYALFADGQPRIVSFKIEMLPDRPSPTWQLVKNVGKKQAAWLSVIGPPLLRLFWLAIPDIDAVKWDAIRARIEAWRDVQVPDVSPPVKGSDLTSLVVVHIEPHAAIGSSITNSANRVQQNLSEKIRSLNSRSNTSGGTVHCFSFQPFHKNNETDPMACERLAGSIHSLLAIQAIGRVRRVEEIARVERERCCRAAMATAASKAVADERFYFANMFLLEEAVSRGYAALSLFDDALAHLDIVDAVLSQSCENCFCVAGGRPVAVWINECLAHAPTHVDCARLVPSVNADWPTSPCPLMLLEAGRHPLIETRAELLSRQAAVVFRMAAADEAIPSRISPSAAAERIASYALQVSHSVLIESRQLAIVGGQADATENSHLSPSIIDAFVYVLYCEAQSACKVLASSSPLIVSSPVNLNILGHHAFQSVIRLGRRSGFMADSPTQPEDSSSLHATVNVLQLLRHRSPAAVGEASSPGSRPENYSDRLARILTGSSPEGFTTTLIELAESLIATFKSLGHHRWGRQISFDLAGIYLQAAQQKCQLTVSPLSTAETLLLDCIGTWLSSKCTDLAIAALKTLVEQCYTSSPGESADDQQRLRKRAWALLHLKAYSKSTEIFEEIKQLSNNFLVKSRSKYAEPANVLNGSFLFTCCDLSLESVAASPHSAVVHARVMSSFSAAIENCHLEIAFRMTSLDHPSSFYGRRSFDSIGDDDRNLALTLPPFRPELSSKLLTKDLGSSRACADELIILKTTEPYTIAPSKVNDIKLKFELPNTPDFEAGASLRFLRAMVNLYGSSLCLSCGDSLKNRKPLILCPPDRSKDKDSAKDDEKLCEISLTDSAANRDANAETRDAMANVTSAFGAEFSLEPVFVRGAMTLFVVVDIIQVAVVADKGISQMVDPVVAVEQDDDETIMLDRPIFDTLSSSSSSSVPRIEISLLPKASEPVLPKILARLVWQLPEKATLVAKQVRVILSSTICHVKKGDEDSFVEEDRLTVSSKCFDLCSLIKPHNSRHYVQKTSNNI